jgi:hypothetical protein
MEPAGLRAYRKSLAGCGIHREYFAIGTWYGRGRPYLLFPESEPIVAD